MRHVARGEHKRSRAAGRSTRVWASLDEPHGTDRSGASRSAWRIGSEPRPVPPDHGIRLDDRQGAPNIEEQPIKADEYQSVDAAEEKPFWRGPPQDIDLLAQHQDLCLERPSRLEQVHEHPPDQP